MNELPKKRPFVPPAVKTRRRLSAAERAEAAVLGLQADASLAIEAMHPTDEQKALFAWFDAEGIPHGERERILLERAKARGPGLGRDPR